MSIKVNIKKDLLDRVKIAAESLGLTLDEYVTIALTNQLDR
jgi:antitoxin component of RelBE/YafQ-DinJ toxin-antitoxin module